MAEDFPESSRKFLLYQTEDGSNRVECRFQDETLWLSQALMAELFDTSPQNITLHLKSLYEEGEITEAATCKEFLQVRQEGRRTHAGKISAEQAKEKAETEYATYRRMIDQQPSEVDKHLADALQKLERLDKKYD